MGFKPDHLIRIAKETTSLRIHGDKTIAAVYLTGSLLTENPFLGGATDIDLVFVHQRKPASRREVIPLSPEIHLDIKHNPIGEYASPRELRVDPWLGPELWNPMLLYETDHFFEFVQAVVRDRFHEPINVIARAQKNMDHARQLWNELSYKRNAGPKSMLVYLKAINHASNAVAILNGPVLAERRLLLQFPHLAGVAGKANLSDALLRLLGGWNIEVDTLSALLPDWEKNFISAGRKPAADARLHPARLGYYKQAMQSMLGGQNPSATLWPLLHSWTLAALTLQQAERTAWRAALKHMGLVGDGFPACLEGLDHFLDEIELLLTNMAANQGIDTIYRDGRKV